MRWAGAVLVGGASRRMGRDKATLELDGTTLTERVARCLRSGGAREVLVVGGAGDRSLVAPPTTRWVPDRWPGRGPVGGIATSLLAAREDVVVVVACDLPELQPSTATRLALLAADVDVAVARSERGREPLIAAWSRRARPVLESALADERSASVHGVLDGLEVVELPVAAAEVVNLNRPEDLAAYHSSRVPVGTVPSSAPGERWTMAVPDIDVEQLAAELAAGKPLIDVREPDEYATARVPGGRLIPLGTVPDRLAEIPTEGTVYVVCRSGGRSAKAVAFLRERGVDAVNVAGGTNAWMEAGREVDRG